MKEINSCEIRRRLLINEHVKCSLKYAKRNRRKIT